MYLFDFTVIKCNTTTCICINKGNLKKKLYMSLQHPSHHLCACTNYMYMLVEKKEKEKTLTYTHKNKQINNLDKTKQNIKKKKIQWVS